MRTIRLYRDLKANAWQMHDPILATRENYGMCVIQTCYTAKAPAETVRRSIQALNTDAVVVIDEQTLQPAVRLSVALGMGR
jgi:hypothetical protein